MSNKTIKKKETFFKNYDLYSDANPSDTVRIKYKTLDDVKRTIKKLEKLYKSEKITHQRNSQIVNVMTQRLRVIKDNFKKGSDRYNLSLKYYNFLKDRTKIKSKKTRLEFRFNI